MKYSSSLKKFSAVTLVLVLCIALVFTMAACNKDDDTDSDSLATAEINDTVTNGSFYTTTGDTYPKTPSSWSGYAGTSSGTYATPTGEDNRISGVINTYESIYDSSKSKWDNLSNPGVGGSPVENDYNVLMLYNKVPTAWLYSNSTTKLEIGNYYRFDINVKTVDISGDEKNTKNGAYIQLSNGISAKFQNINTDGEWATYSVYVESSATEITSVTIILGLGYGSTQDGMLTKGYAFFDSIKLASITEAEYDTAVAKQQGTEKSDRVSTYSLRFKNPSMELYGSTNSSKVSTPTNYTTLTGGESGNYANVGSYYLTRGIVDYTSTEMFNANFQYKDSNNEIQNVVSAFPVNTQTIDNYAMMIYHKKYPTSTPGTASGYKSSTFYVPMGKIVKVSVWVYTDIRNDDAATNDKRGATLILNGTEKITTAAINTNKQWQQITFYIKGSDTINYSYNLELWLGQGGLDKDDTHAWGVALFDNIEFDDDISIGEYNAATESEITVAIPDSTGNTIDRQLKTTYKVAIPTQSNLLTNGSFSTDGVSGDVMASDEGWKFAPIDDVVVNEGDVVTAQLSSEQLKNAEYLKSLGIKDDDGNGVVINTPNENAAFVQMINNKVPSAYQMSLTDEEANAIVLHKNSYYRFTMWIKTYGIASGSGATLSLYDGSGDDATSIQSFSSINTDGYINGLTNGYRLYSVFIEVGDSDDINLDIRLSLGSGSKITPTTFVSGYVFASNVSLNEITYNDYKNASTDTYTLKKSMATTTTTTTITNGTFNSYDSEKTTYDENGNFDKPAVPSGWSTVGSQTTVKSGIVDVENAATVNGYISNTANNVYNAWEGNVTSHPVSGHIVTGGSPRFLYLRSDAVSEGETQGNATGYKSSSFSLSSNTYYIITVDVKTVSGSASIYFTPTSNTSKAVKFENINTNNYWRQYVIAVEVGMTSMPAELSLYLGGTSSSTSVVGEVYFDNANYVSFDDKDKFDKVLNSYKDDRTETGYRSDFAEVNFVVDGFDSFTTATPLNTPSNFSGSAVGADGDNNPPTGSSNLVAGVANNNVDFNYFGILDADGNEIENAKLTNADIKDAIFTDSYDIGDNLLVINNKVKTGYTYKTKSSKSIAAGAFYEVSIWVNTFYVASDSGANVKLMIGDNTHTFKLINTNSDKEDISKVGTWTKYSFYVANRKTSSLTSVYLQLSLGAYGKDNWTQGYAFFDNFTMTKITEDEYNTAVEGISKINDPNSIYNGKNIDATLTKWKLEYLKDETTSSEADTEDTTDETDNTPSTDPNLWIYITSGVIGLMLIIAVIVVLVRKYKKPSVKRTKKVSYDKSSRSNTSNNRRDEYNKYKDK